MAHAGDGVPLHGHTCILLLSQAETFTHAVNAELGRLVAETRYFAAVLYAPGEVSVDDGDGRGKTTFPPKSLQVAFEVLT